MSASANFKQSDPFIEAIAQRTVVLMCEMIREVIREEMKPRKTCSTGDAAEYVGLTETALRQKKSKGQVPEYCFKKEGGTVVWYYEGLDRWRNQRDDED